MFLLVDGFFLFLVVEVELGELLRLSLLHGIHDGLCLEQLVGFLLLFLLLAVSVGFLCRLLVSLGLLLGCFLGLCLLLMRCRGS